MNLLSSLMMGLVQFLLFGFNLYWGITNLQEGNVGGASASFTVAMFCLTIGVFMIREGYKE